MLLCQMKSVVMTSSDCSQSTSLNHSHLLLRQQIQRLDQAVTQLQVPVLLLHFWTFTVSVLVQN